MKTRTVLIVDDSAPTIQMIQDTLDEASTPFEICSNSVEAWDRIRTNPQITNVLMRFNASEIDGCNLTRRIREVKSPEQLPILMIVSEDQLEYAGNALEAGANDVLIDPFEARELRMRMNIPASSQRRRMDDAHPTANAECAATAAAGPVTYEEGATQTERVSNLVVPKLDPQSMRFIYGDSEDQIAAWKNDESVTKIPMDKIMVCPCCSAVPTFRLGCGTCGSAFSDQDTLIHHYACAHIGAQSEFRQGSDIVCPKCLCRNMVAGSDFEIVSGGYACADCGTKSTEQELIGHCLSCQHRFAAREAVVVELTGLHVHRIQEVRRKATATMKSLRPEAKAACAT